MNMRVRAEAGQESTAMRRLNDAAVGAEQPQPVEITVGLEVYPKGKADGMLHVPMCSGIVQACEQWWYPPHRAFDDDGRLYFHGDQLPIDPAQFKVGAHGIYRMLATVLQRRGSAIVKPIAAVYLPTNGIEFRSGQYEYAPGCWEAAQAYCERYADRLMGKRGSSEFLDDDGNFNEDLDALLYWRGQVVLRPHGVLEKVWGRTLDLRRLGVNRWLKPAAAVT